MPVLHVIFGTYVIGEIIAIPFTYLFSKRDTSDFGIMTERA
jgi:hypothetical protein